MKVNLLDGADPLVISEDRGIIMKKVATEILDHLSIIYDISDFKLMNFHIKGVEKIIALSINVSLKFVESDDVINTIRDRMSNVITPNESDPGLSFMSMNKRPLTDSIYGISGGHSEICFWYQFTNEEILKWNGNHIYSFDMY